jgi:aspartyl-tRNA(Asn)/glutamyl-tRNA(Gln) amidotransferase subunit C
MTSKPLIMKRGDSLDKISRDGVAYVAHLARLSFSEEEMGKFTSQLNDILLYMDKLSEVDTTGVAPMTHAIAQKNAFRKDSVVASLPIGASLANAPEARGSCFQVPKVIE